jgi:hypothetical protein
MPARILDTFVPVKQGTSPMKSPKLWAYLVGIATLLALLGSAAAQAHPRLAKGKYKVKLDSAPPGATVYIDRKELGPVGVTPWNATLAAGEYVLLIELDGYQPAQRTVKIVRSRKLQEIFMPMIKKLDPPRIDIRADADKNVFDANVFLDGQAQGRAPVLLTTDPGRHLVELKKDDFETFSTWVDAKENEKVSLTPVLKPVAKAKVGTLVVDADVPDAEVLLDGNKVAGTTPVFITDVIEGLHVVEVRKEPAVPWKQTVQVLAGTQAKVRAELKATIGGQGGVIRVLSNIAGAKVFLDGTEMGSVPVDIKDVKTGEHVLEVKAPGYQTREERVTVNAGQSTILKLDLNAEAGKGESGTLKVVSPVPDADVYIDGAAIGKVPQEKAVTRGEHFVVVKLAGFKTFEQKVRIEPGQTLTVSAELKAVGRLRIISDPPGSEVLINGLPQGVTPLELNEVEVGTTIVRVVKNGYQVWEQTLNLEGGKTETLSANLSLEGKSPDELLAEQRGLASFGARTLPRGRSTVDFGLGYPYFLETRVNVGAGKVANFGFDAGVGVRSMGSRSELGLGVRFMMVDNDPFSAGVFGDLWWGSRLIDNSKRNGLTFNAGAVASLTAFTRVTVSGRLYLNMFSDRHCPEPDTTQMNGFDGEDPIEVCTGYLEDDLSPTDKMRAEELTGSTGEDFFGRDGGMRVMTSVIAEIALYQRWNGWFILEGAPFQSERALYTDMFSAPLFESDFGTYARVGATYKF